MMIETKGMLWRSAAAALGLAVFAPGAQSQGNLSTQGFGFPPGQISTRSHGSAGATAEIDAWSPLNPGAIAGFTSRVMSFQLEPEFRRVTFSGQTDRTTTARYPLVFAALPVGERWVVGASASTLLDRSWSTMTKGTEQIGTDVVETETQQTVQGAMNDLRLAAAWSNRTWLRVGGGLHAVSGRNTVSIGRVFPDTSKFAPFQQSVTISFRGIAASAGAEINLGEKASVGLSYRLGGTLRALGDDTTYSRAQVPDRFGATIAFTGITGTTLAARAAFDGWSSLASLGSGNVGVQDTWDRSLGAEVAGPRFGARALMLRAGIRNRDLPFEAGGRPVTENSLSLGTGTSFGSGRVIVDVAGIYARRDAGLSMTERAWTVSVGLSARP